ncbi:Acyl-CoA synthetase (AMP-forming)/AMP-acid ligase II [Litoreibacter albidus]|uniref:Acyl-CoA synthetase (AMP-forming)/AMP-acid ligase II n=2 Tax=Litoreibacter albidus TaxID=670155 RepID=A0A1H2T7D9_9RHOB|nr:Acyl-CoA synthetase (AMP-forming)/AMP-acid ligase II [Litoreibacter albidus]
MGTSPLVMQSVFDHGPPPPCPSPFNMAAYVLSYAPSLGNKPALEVVGGDASVLTYDALCRRVQRVAGGLRAQGLNIGDRVLFRLGNTPDFPIAYLACIWAGLVPIPASSQLTKREATDIARQTQPALILHQDGVSLPDSAAPVLGELPEAAEIPPVMGDPDRLAYIVFTSGTSGRPTGVRHAHRAIWARRMMWDGWYGLRQDDRVMHAGAFNWTYTLGTGLMDPWSMGATALIPSAGVPSDALAGLVAKHNASIFAAAPGVYRQMLKFAVPTMPALRHGLSAGESLPDAVRIAWQETTGTDIHEALGMSECSTLVSGSPTRPARKGTSGRPQVGRRIAVVQDGAPVPVDTPGLLAIHRDDPGLMLGTLDADLVTEGAWFVTADTVSMGADGDITYLGRSDDMMNAGGYRVSPLEVEAAFAGYAAMTGCAAVTVEVKADTEVIALFYSADGPLQDEALRAHAQALLARYKQPRLYIHRATLPKGTNGKLNRRLLRYAFEDPHD